MPRIDSAKFYTNAIEKFGETPQGLNWLTQESQELRFKEILALLPQDLSSFSLGDAGCGFGDFYHYLSQQKKKPQHYTGIDSLQKMVDIASKKTQEEILCLDICTDTLPTRDYYICSGALNILHPFETHLFLRNCYKASRYAFIFNCLYADKESETYNYLQKKSIESIALELNVEKIIYRENYLENDITLMFMKR